MEGFNGDGNDGHQFNDEGYASALGGGFISGYTGGDFNSGYGDGGFNSGIDGGGHTRDFLSQPPSFSASGAHTSAGAPPPGFPSSSNHTPSQLRLDSLDLNASHSWPDMHAYQGILQSGAQHGDSGSFAPLAVTSPPPRGRARLHLAAYIGHRLPSQTNTSLFCALCPHSCAPGNDFPVGHPSLNCSKPSTLNFGVLCGWTSGKEVVTCWYEYLINPIKP